MDKKREKKTIADSVCRVHRSGGYAVLSNCFVRSIRIGCDSIALLGKIMDLPPTWNFTIAGLVAICKDGEMAVRSQLAELEEWGYAKKVLQKPNENSTGQFRYVYDFYEYSEKDDSIPKYDIEMETFTADNATLMRIKKDSNFTMVSGKLLRSNEIRNKLIGFMLKVLSLPNSWRFSMPGLQAICKEGKTAVHNTSEFPPNIRRQQDSRRSCAVIRLTASSPRSCQERTQTALNSGLCLTMCVRVTPSTSKVSAGWVGLQRTC